MGCVTSKPLVDPTDDVLRYCKIRRSHIHNAIKYRRDFATAHTAYIHSLGGVGSALRHFALGEFVDGNRSPQHSHPAILALPQPSTPSLGGLSPPPQQRLHVSGLSPPHSGSRVSANPSPPSSLPPLTTPISPTLSPIRLPNSNPSIPAQSLTYARSPSPPESSPASLHEARQLPAHATDKRWLTSRSFNSMVSPDRGSEFSPPYYSPSRDDLDDALVAYSPPPPSSLLADSSSWFDVDTFTPDVIPYHLQEQRRMKRVGSSKQEETSGAVQIEETDGMPDLEEVEHVEHETAHDNKGASVKNPALVDEVEKRVVLEEAVPVSELKANDKKAGVSNGLEENPSVVPSIPREMTARENVGNEMPIKEPAATIILKERSLSEAMRYIEELFVRAFQCGLEVSRMLETQTHLPSKANSVKDTSKVFNAITSHWSKRTSSIMIEDSKDDDLSECGMAGSHASTLERLYAWERKLFNEVKEGKLLRTAFDLKYKQLHNYDAKGGNKVVRDKLKVTLKKLDTRLMVAIRAIRAASLRVQSLTNEELYPQLREMLEGLLSMWRMIAECHRLQTAIAIEMQNFDDSVSEIEMTEAQKKASVKLRLELENLKTHFQGWILSQRNYIVELEEWIKKCYEAKEPSKLGSSRGSRRTSSDTTDRVPIFQLLKEWREAFEELDSQQDVVNDIKSFASMMRMLEENQSNELKLKKLAERYSRRFDQQTTYLNKLERRHSERGRDKIPTGLRSKQARLDRYKSQADMGKHEHLAAMQLRKDTTLDLLKQQLPILFESMSVFAEHAKDSYEDVKRAAEAAEEMGKPKETERIMWGTDN